MENIKDTNVPTEEVKDKSQEEIDNAVASAKARWNKKLEKDYVTIEKYNELASQLQQAQHDLQLPKLQQMFANMGGKSEAFKDIVALNPQLFECKDDKEIQTLLDSIKKDKSYFFNSQSFNASVANTNNVEVDKKYKDPIGNDYSNGSLLRTK